MMFSMVIVHMKQQMNRSKAHVSQLVKTGNRKARGGGGGVGGTPNFK